MHSSEAVKACERHANLSIHVSTSSPHPQDTKSCWEGLMGHEKLRTRSDKHGAQTGLSLWRPQSACTSLWDLPVLLCFDVAGVKTSLSAIHTERRGSDLLLGALPSEVPQPLPFIPFS